MDHRYKFRIIFKGMILILVNVVNMIHCLV